MQKLNFFMVLSFFSLFFFMNLIQESGMLSNLFFYDNFIKLMLVMTITFFFFMLTMNLINYKKNFVTFFLILLYIILLLFFSNENLFFFYVFFEMSIIPMLYFVSSWGYSLERIKAMMYMYIYTIFFSLPFLIYLIYYDTFMKSFSIMYNNSSMSNYMEETFFMFFPLIFLVKIPVWGFHFWLPKAHVEASTEGSMILAGIILKLSGLGLIKFSYIWYIANMNNFMIFFYFSISSLGAIFISLYALRMTDSKIIVALSSIIHMSIIFLIFVMSSSISMEVMYLMMVAHGFISPLMFFFLSKIYEKMLSRSISFSRGILKNTNSLSIFWFLLCGFNMGIPLSMNFLSEFEFFIISANFCLMVSFFMITMTLTSGILNISLYNFFSSGKKKFFFYLKNYKYYMNFLTMFMLYVTLYLFFMEEY